MTVFVLLLLLSEPALAIDGATVTPDGASMELDADAKALADEAFASLQARRFEDAARQFGALAQAGAGPTARTLQGLALYELGDLRAAQQALEGVPGLEAQHLLGLVLVDRGEQTKGVALLEAARASGDPRLAAHARLNLALVDLDRGELAEAEQGLRAALQDAGTLNDPGLEASARSGLASLALLRGELPKEGGGGLDAGLSAVGDMLGRGDLAGARRGVDTMRKTAVTRRERVLLGLAEGSVLRATGQPEAAARVLTDTLAEARACGLTREVSQALASLAVAHAQAGRVDLALALMGEAEDTALGAGQLAAAQQYGAEVGLLALRLERNEAAAQKLTELRHRGGQVPEAEARIAELEGGLAAADQRPDAALIGYTKAVTWYEAHGRNADAARAATSCTAALEMSDPSAAAAWGQRALKAFKAAGDPLGPAHLALARGLAHARAKDLEGALALFAEASRLADAQSGPQARQVAQTAQTNSAKALVAMGASAQAAERSASEGADKVMEHQRSLTLALALYDEGLAAYNAGRYSTARARFAEAQSRLASLGERSYEAQARRAGAWASYNTAVAMDPQQSWPFWTEILAEAQAVEDSELHARALVAQAVCAQRLNMSSSEQLLRAAAAQAEAVGMPEVAARAWAALADTQMDLAERARCARRAFALAPNDPGSAYAMYSVSVDAYNAENLELARALAEEVYPSSGKLRDAVRAVLDATAP